MTPIQFLQKNSRRIIVAMALLMLGLAIYVVIDSLPPRRFTILTGREGGAYFQSALRYQAIAAERGFEIDIRPTSGSVETLRLLEEGEAGIGFVQGGIALEADPQLLSTLASVFYEPVWGIYNPARFNDPLVSLRQLEGKTIAIPEAGSGANVLLRKMMAANRMDEALFDILELSTEEAAQGLRNGSIDAAFFVQAASSPVIQDLLAVRDLDLMSFGRADAYSAQFPYLTTLRLPEGALDLHDNIPGEDKTLVSTAANLIVRSDFHPDLLRLMTIAVVEVHESGGLFEKRFEFPNFDHADLPIGREERAYMERIRGGDSTLDNYLPFWAAALIDRYMLFVLPIALLLLPLITRSPVLLTLYNKRKITRWYRIVRTIDRQLTNMDQSQIELALADLDNIEHQLQENVTVSETYMADYYDLRGHIDLVQARLVKRRATAAA